MNEDMLKMAKQSVADKLISSLLPGNNSLEVEERLREMLLAGKLDERRLEIAFSDSDIITGSVKE